MVKLVIFWTFGKSYFNMGIKIKSNLQSYYHNYISIGLSSYLKFFLGINSTYIYLFIANIRSISNILFVNLKL